MSTGTIIKARDVNYAIATSFGSAIPITSISLAAEAVVTTTSAHGLADLTAVKFDGILGMTELNGLVLVVDVLSSTTFKLINYSTLNSPAYVSGGNAYSAVFTNHCELTGWTGQSGSTPETDDSTWCDAVAKIGFGRPDPGSLTVNYNYADSLVTTALEASRLAGTLTVFRIGFTNYTSKVFEIGTVTQSSGGISDAANGKWEGSATLRRRFDPIRATPTA